MSLIEPFHYGFMQKAAAASVLAGLLCAVVGVYVVLRRMALVGDALSHSAFPGIVLAYLGRWNIFLGAMIAVLATALGIGAFAQKDTVYEDTAVGITTSAMFVFGIILMSWAKSYRDLSSMLFGNILGVTSWDMKLLAAIAVAVMGIIFFFEKEFTLFSFDRTYARSIGISINFLRYLLLILLALTVVAGIQVVGTILTSALLVAPAAAARLLVKSFRKMMLIACLIAVSSCLGGLYLSYYLGFSTGAAIVLIATVFFGLAFIGKRVAHKKIIFPILILSLAILTAATAHEEHKASHGGTLIELGEEDAHLELVLDPNEGKLTAYVLDGDAEKPVRIAQEQIEIKTKDRGNIILKAVPNFITGESLGDTSEFVGQSERLKNVSHFDGVVESIYAAGKEFDGVSFHFPERE